MPCGMVPDLQPRGRGFESYVHLAYQHRRSVVASFRGQLMSTSESWEVNGHTTRCTTPSIRGPLAEAIYTEISAVPWALESWGKDFLPITKCVLCRWNGA